MKAFLYLLAVLAALAGVAMLAVAKSVFHEIEAGVAFLMAITALGFGGVISAIEGTADAARRAAVPTVTPRACDVCGQVTTGAQATRVVVGGETKHVCPACVDAALQEDARAAKAV